MSQPIDYYNTDPNDPEAPVRLESYAGISVGDTVAYTNPAWRQPDGTYRTAGMDPPLVVSALYRFIEVGGAEDYVTAILDEGTWEVNADNLTRWSPDELTY